jgi:murein L,D-transpeptidase YcbB/YkuD
MKLLKYFIQNDSSLNPEKLDSIFKTNKEYGITIKPSVPVYIVYFTSWVNENGLLNFRNDIYNLDKQLSSEVFGE